MELALAAGSALVAALVTEGWNAARDGVVGLWRRVHPERVPSIEADLNDARGELVAASASSDSEAELVTEWRRRFTRLLAEHPEVGDDLREMMDQQWLPLLGEAGQARVQNITMKAEVRDEGRAYMAAGDQHFHRE